MTVDELLRQLSAMFPQSFSAEEGLAFWGRVYRDNLDAYSGVPLREGFKEVMATWTNGWAPKPAEIAPACERARAVLHRPKPGAGVVNMKRISEEAKRLKPVLVEDWFRGNGAEVDSFLERFEGPGGGGAILKAGEWDGRIPELSDRQLALRKLAGLVQQRAFDVAMAMASEGHFIAQPHVSDDPVRRRRRQIEIDAGDLDRIKGQVHSRQRGYVSPFAGALRDVTLRDGPGDEAREITEEDWDERTATEEGIAL